MFRWAKAPRCATVGAIVCAAIWCAGAAPAVAEVVINVDKATQRMTVTVDGGERYAWPVSTGLAGGPPAGAYRPVRLEPQWYSHMFGMAPMPHSIFFRGPFAIHGTTAVSRLGQRASHGCVRLHPDNAATLFALVQQQGPANTRILISR
jgi:lipoprotein-anchoring transpeptidase ErfK/SrfK